MNTMSAKQSMRFDGKRILFLSAGAFIQQVVEVAQKMGIYCIVTDYYLDHKVSPAKDVADEYWDISWSDIEALEKKCIERKVDGVFTGFSEGCVLAAISLCERLGFPFYATKEQILETSDKVAFKHLCERSGVNAVKEYCITKDATEDECKYIEYPVVVKPADSAGSRGISVCRDYEELVTGIHKALSFSPSESFVVEQFMSGTEVNAHYTLQNGTASLACMSDAIHGYSKKGGIKLTEAWIYPSKYISEFEVNSDADCKRLLKNIDAKNGVFQFATFFENSKFYVFEVGYRLGGGTNYNVISANNDINYLEMMLAHCLTGEMQGWNAAEKDDPHFKKYCCNFTPNALPGVIGHLGDISEIRKMDGVLSVDQLYFEGQEIPDSGAMNQNLIRVNVIADTPAELADRVDRIYEMIDIRDEQGNSMFASRLAKSVIEHYWD
ncbi:MAG: ATP-grasp domain-containing protein [Clostridiales bacterium]|nr:ATP-grasp domain-containing protein [Clostridiales bacterium]